jgi:LmbE family N-acetylglucosaminyl deacetylase
VSILQQTYSALAKIKIMRWIYLSPHFDDAVLSCGGLIFEQSRQGIQAEIWTIFAGDAPDGPLSPLALRCHADWGIPDVHDLVAIRRDEDQAAAAIVGAEIVHFSLPDCIYRRDADGVPLYPEEVFVPFHAFDQGLDADIAAALAAELEPDDVLVSPLAIGDHIDHRLARLAAERLNSPLRYYADIPYVIRRPEALAPATQAIALDCYPVSEAGLQAWIAGAAAYQTQMVMVFESDANMRAALRADWENRHGICLTHYPSPSISLS